MDGFIISNSNRYAVLLGDSLSPLSLYIRVFTLELVISVASGD
jgi:hypothetical protein